MCSLRAGYSSHPRTFPTIPDFNKENKSACCKNLDILTFRSVWFTEHRNGSEKKLQRIIDQFQHKKFYVEFNIEIIALITNYNKYVR